MSVLRRIALGFPVSSWSHQRAWCVDSLAEPGARRYFIEWNPDDGVYGEDFDGAPRDDGRVLLSGPQRYYHPIRIAQFALHRLGLWCTKRDQTARADFLAQADWLRDRQQSDGMPGLYVFNFPWSKYGAPAGWCSAMAQGEAISVLLRANHIEPNAGYADAAVRASLPFGAGIDRGGVVWESGDEIFFEEIANRHAPHVLNGCIYALWGIWELWKVTDEPWLRERIERCVATLRAWLPRFDTGWWSLYSLLFSATGQPHVATLKYHQFHIAQMRVLAKMFGEPLFEQAANRWSEYGVRRTSRARLVGKTLLSLPERFLGRDTVLGGAHT
jgi:heparosan-N-sulfate-glucuronate 5-epimerase